MLAISSSPLRSTHGRGEEKSREDEGEILLDDINFDDIFVGFDVDGSCDILPDLEIDPVDDIIFADFSFSSGSGSGEEEEEELVAGRDHGGNNIVAALVPDRKELDSCKEYLSQINHEVEEEDGSVLLVSAAAESAAERSAASSGEIRSGRKLSTTATATKDSHGKKKKKKKAKVDWTPELHRRFVQAVEQLGVDKAVPSRILELMGIDCLTRHNIASHLQKYRSHRKHLLAREAEAASWSQRRQIYDGVGGGSSSVMKRAVDMKKHSWQAPPQMRPLIRVPLHVWGHPSAADHPQLVPVWPRHLTPPPPQPWLPSRPLPVVGPVPPPMSHDPNSYWHIPAHYQMALTQGMPFFPPPPPLLLPAMRFQAPPVPSIPPALSSSHINAAATTVNPASPSTVFDAHPSNEKIDAAIGDVLAKPWSAMPLGLKPPSLESVMVELQRQGVAKVPPSSTSGG